MGKRREGGFGERGQSCSLLLDVYYLQMMMMIIIMIIIIAVYIYIHTHTHRHIRGDPGFREGSRAWT